MTDGGSRKVVVEICNARNLMPKDGQGTASAFVIVDFDGQRRRTKTKLRDLNPQWDETLEFLVHDPDALPTETLEINVYNDKKTGRRSTFLGKVKISGATLLGSRVTSEAEAQASSLVYYPLEKRSVFSQVKGEIGLRICYVHEPPPPAAAAAATEACPAAAEEKPDDPQTAIQEKKAEGNDKPPVTVTDGKKPEEKKSEDKPSAPKEEEKTDSPPGNPKPGEATPAADDTSYPSEEKQGPPVPPSPVKDAQHSGFSDLEIQPVTSERAGGTSYDLVDRVPYLFVRVLKAKRVRSADAGRPCYAKVVIGSHSVQTRTVKATDWDQVFSFHKESLNSTALDVSVWEEEEKKNEGGDDNDNKVVADASLGSVSFDLQEIPKRSSQDSPLAPQWYTLEGLPEGSLGNDVMLAVWIGTQADESFQEAWQSDSGGLIVYTRSKAYLSPKLWYLRLTVIQTQDLRFPYPPPVVNPESKAARPPELYVKGQLGSQVFKTGRVALCTSSSSANPSWNEDLLFVATEPLEPFLTIVVEDATASKPVGQARVALSSVHRRLDDRAEPPSRWLNLAGGDVERPYAGRVHVRVCLEGGYHVLDEAAHVASDVRAASKQLSKPPIGQLEVGVRGAANLVPMKVAKDGASGSTDAYVVLKYGPKWARTRTILDNFNPRWNEQYAWDVFDPCTVLTIAVFDNARFKMSDNSKRDVRIGKVRIRLSTLDTNRVYAKTFPLTAIQPSGAKKMGELELAVRFSCSSWLSLIQAYGSPMLPRMHYVRPLGPAQQDVLRGTAMLIVSARLARSEPPLGPEVVQYVLETDAHAWSMRRSKANWFRVVGCLSKATGLVRWVHSVRTWERPSTTLLVHVLLGTVALWPHLILPTSLFYLFLILIWRYYRARPREPSGMDPRLSQVDTVGPDELDEELDGFPTGRAAELVRVRYDRLRVVAGRAQALLGDVAAQGERVEALLAWRDPRATAIFVVFCLVASLVFYAVPFRMLALAMGFYYLRHPRFRDDMPSRAFNFFRRLPSLSDRII